VVVHKRHGNALEGKSGGGGKKERPETVNGTGPQEGLRTQWTGKSNLKERTNNHGWIIKQQTRYCRKLETGMGVAGERKKKAQTLRRARKDREKK